VTQLEIHLLGDFRLSYNGNSLTTLNTRLQTLLVYLLLHRQHPQPRQHIAFVFWPDSSENQAFSNLRTLYARLRKNLPQADLFLQADHQTMQWRLDAPFSLDVAKFETAVNTAATITDWQTAINLYYDNLLPNWYDEWLVSERERLQQLFFRANETLMQMLEDQRHYQSAAQAAQRLLRHDPLHEATYRRLMRVQALAGNKAGALRTFHTCATRLEKELSVVPDKSTRDLYERLLRVDSAVEPKQPTASETASIPFVGRGIEWNQLKQSWQRAARGFASMVLINGEAGIGKSRLAAELLQWANRQGIITATTRSYEAEGKLSYGPLLTWLRTDVLKTAWEKLDDVVLTELARLLPEILVERLDLSAPAALTQAWQRQRLFEALASALLAHGRPVLLHIDDLQWCDQETMQWLHFLLRFAPTAPLLLIGTYRPEEIQSEHPLIALQLALRQSRQLKELALEPLSEEETAALATHLSSDVQFDRLYQETEGNPLFIVEMMRAGLSPSDSLPPTIQATITARFAQLTEDTREVMVQAAVLGRAFDYHLLAEISSLSEDVLVNSLDELWRRRIIREHGGAEYDFSHDKIREVAYTQLSQTRRRWLHQRVAQSLAAHHPSNLETYSSQIAVHYEMAQMPQEAINYYLLAAQAAQHLFANTEAISTIRRALQLLDTIPATVEPEWQIEVTAKLQESLGDLLYFTVQYEEALQAYRVAQTALTQTVTPDPIWLCRLQRKIGSAHMPLHQYDEALHQFELAKSSLGSEPTESEVRWWREWINLQQERKLLFYWLNKWQKMADILEESRPILVRYGTPTQRAFFFDPSMFFVRDRYNFSDEVMNRTREWFAANIALNDPTRKGALHFMLGLALLLYGNFTEAETTIQTALTIADQTGDFNLRARCLTYLTVAYRKQGQVEKVRDQIASCIAAAEEATMPEYVATAKANMAWVAWHDGDFEQVQQNGCSAFSLWHALPKGHASYVFQWTARFPMMAVALAEGNLAEAITHVQAVLDPTQQKLAEELTAVLQSTLITWKRQQPAQTAELLAQAITLAQKFHYL